MHEPFVSVLAEQRNKLVVDTTQMSDRDVGRIDDDDIEEAAISGHSDEVKCSAVTVHGPGNVLLHCETMPNCRPVFQRVGRSRRGRNCRSRHR